MSVGQKLIVTVGAFVITFVTICTIFKDDISFILTSRSIERKYGNTTENSYYIEIPKEIIDSDDVSLVIDVRNKSLEYIINQKK